MTRLRLTILLPFVSHAGGGVTEAVRLLAHALHRSGDYEIQILSFAHADDRAARADWPDVVFRSFRRIGPASYGCAPGMALYMLRHRCDVVLVHGIWMFHVLAGALAMLRGIPVIVTPHGMLAPWILARSRRLKAAVSRLYQDRVLAQAHAVQALTPVEAAEIRAASPRARIVTIPNVVPPIPVDPPAAGWLTPGLAGRRVFLFFGRIHDKKGWRELLAAWRQLCRDQPAFRDGAALVFCGWIDGVPDFAEAVAAAGDDCGNVTFAGPQFGADRAASYRAADHFVLPSHSEGLPMAVLEAVQGGASVLMSRECNLPAMIAAGAAIETGTTPDRIAAALWRAFGLSPAEDAAMRRRAEAHLAEHYSEASVVARFGALFRSPRGAATAQGGDADV